MKINEVIEEKLRENPAIDRGAALLYLFRLWAGISGIEVTASTIRAVNHLKIVEINPISETLIWNIPLFSDEEPVDIFSGWVEEYRMLFLEVNPSRAGSKKSVYAKMEKFLKAHPDVTSEMVLEATRMYIADLRKTDSIRYIHQADYFISKQDLSDKSVRSLLELWIEVYRQGGTQGFNTALNIIE